MKKLILWILVTFLLIVGVYFLFSYDDISPKVIANKVFDQGIEEVIVMSEYPMVPALNKEQIKSLRDSIYEGTEFGAKSENQDNQIVSSWVPNTIDFNVKQSSKNAVLLRYNKSNGLLYVAKIQVNIKDQDRYMSSTSLTSRYLNGVYFLKPSPKFKTLLQDLKIK